MDIINEQVRDALAAVIPAEAISLEVPPSAELGDFAQPCFPLAKEMKKAPAQIASELAERIATTGLIASVQATGPYLNIFLDRVSVALLVLDAPLQVSETGRTVLFEYPSPNTNKPLHLGHVRNMLLGSSMAAISKAAGNDVVRVNLNNDRGVHICKSMLAYQKWGGGRTPTDLGLKGDHFVGHWYVEFAKAAKQDASLEEEAQQMLVDWEAGDDTVMALWDKMNSWALEGFAETFSRFGITFDKQYYESQIYDAGKQIVGRGLASGVFGKDDKGNIVCDLESEGLGTKVLLRADGTTVYMTQDLYLAQTRQEEFTPDAQVYVVGEEQQHHFRQLFTILSKLGMEHSDSLHHLSYGLISLPDGRMKSREGTVVDADDLLTEMEELAAVAISERHPELSESEVSERAVAIGHAALRFFILKYEPKTGFVYDPKESMSFEGETGPYIQYAIARINRLLEDAGHVGDAKKLSVVSDEEWELVTLMRQTMSVIVEASEAYKPHLVARHALSLAQSFTAFYHEHRVLDDEHEHARIALILAVKRHLEFLLGLLGISAPDQM